MKSTRSNSRLPSKAPTGITGFDEITGGGLPRGRTTLIVGGPGSGKTLFALQFLAHGARICKEPGVLVAFEESPARIIANAEGFTWKLSSLRPGMLQLVDAQPSPDLVQSGDFDLDGLLAGLDARIRDTKARRVVFDALDIVLSLLPTALARRRETYRLNQWLIARGLTGVITSKAGGEMPSASDGVAFGEQPFGFMQFMVDCAVMLGHGVAQGVSHRNLRVLKYRGSSFDENEAPFLIGKSGFEVAGARAPRAVAAQAAKGRVSTGIERLDTMLGGGYYRGASVLITGFPGTAKTTLCGAFASAACQRSERTLLVSFDSDLSEVIRNLGSVGIRLGRFIAKGTLRMASVRTTTGSAEINLEHIKRLAADHKARCIVIDPVSGLSIAGNEMIAHSVAVRLIDWAKANGTTLLCTSRLDEISSAASPAPPLHFSTLADTWIHLSYLVQAGERNRGLSIVKSRGTAHSNQVRELVLSDSGVTLTDAYTAGGEVLMGTMRWEKEGAELTASEVSDVAGTLKRVRLDAEEAALAERMKSLQAELVAKQAEKVLLTRSTESRERVLSQGRTRMRELRGADAAKPGRR